MRVLSLFRFFLVTLAIIRLPLCGTTPEAMAQLDHFQAEQNLSLRTDRDSLVGGIVSPFSGQICAECVDMQVQAAQPLALKRRYLAPYILHNYLKRPDGLTPDYDFCFGGFGPSASSKNNMHDQEHY